MNCKQRKGMVLVFSKCFHAGFGASSVFKQSVKEGTNSFKLFAVFKLKTYFIFISGVVVHSVCHY